MGLTPTGTQWRRWKLPSKYSALGLLGTILSIALAIFFYLAPRAPTISAETVLARMLDAARETRDVRFQDANKHSSWEDREQAIKAAEAEYEANIQRSRRLSSEFATLVRGSSNSVGARIVRVLEEQGISEALRYFDQERQALLQKAAETSRRARDEKREQLRPFLQAAELHLLQGNFDEAASLFEEIIDLDADWPEAVDMYVTSLTDYAHRQERSAHFKAADSLGGRAIELLRKRGSKDSGSATEQLAWILVVRGNTRFQLGTYDEALADYGEAIALLNMLRQGEEWSPEHADAQAAVLVNRANILRNRGMAEAALVDYNEAIRVREDLRKRMDGEWPVRYANTLANAYMNRANALQALNQREEAIKDYSKAIAYREAIRRQMENRWPNVWADQLAQAYMNRGNVQSLLDEFDLAIHDLGQAIELRESLRLNLGEQWPPIWSASLAVAYVNRCVARRDAGEGEGAIDDADRAISILERLRADLGDQFPHHWTNDLAVAYMNRGSVLVQLGQSTDAIVDYERAIQIRNALREKHDDEHWLPLWRASDAKARFIRTRLLQRPE